MNTFRSLSELLSLAGKRALITGAAAGIGRAIACRFAEAGADLHLVDLAHSELQSVQKELSPYPSEVNIHQVDISKPAAREHLWAQLPEGSPDILVNNAAIYPFRDFVSVDEPFYSKVFRTNLDSVYWMCQSMICRRLALGGNIINIGSIEAVLPFKEDLAHYSISKAAVLALTRALAKEHGRHGFRINAIIPGGVLTEGVKKAGKNILRLKLGLIRSGIAFKQRLPIGRLGKPDEVALMVLVLAADISSYVHGAAISVDGGFLSA